MKKFVILLIIGLAGAAAYSQFQRPEETALATFLRYHAIVASGRSFEEDAAFYSAARQAEVQSRIDAVEDAETLKSAYLSATQTQASCSELTLADEIQNGATTRLVFDVKDTCGTYEEGTKVQEIIELVPEDGGWKISLNETSVSN